VPVSYGTSHSLDTIPNVVVRRGTRPDIPDAVGKNFAGQLGREHGGAAGERLADLLGIQVTSRAVLRFLHALALPSVIAPHVIGLDDWAWKRRKRYGAIVVDLERNRPIALRADRSQKTVT
jgi:hypothetical protein